MHTCIQYTHKYTISIILNEFHNLLHNRYVISKFLVQMLQTRFNSIVDCLHFAAEPLVVCAIAHIIGSFVVHDLYLLQNGMLDLPYFLRPDLIQHTPR